MGQADDTPVMDIIYLDSFCLQRALDEGEWGRMNARDRGTLMYKLADEMDAHREELATLETLDSGAVYTLALKTHIGMSIDTFRYFAGWCDKIHVSSRLLLVALSQKIFSFVALRQPI